MNPTILPGVINIHLRAPTSITKSERSSLTLMPPCAILILAEVVEKNVEHNMRDLIEPVLVKQA